jgi:hypothetical protein
MPKEEQEVVVGFGMMEEEDNSNNNRSNSRSEGKGAKRMEGMEEGIMRGRGEIGQQKRLVADSIGRK